MFLVRFSEHSGVVAPAAKYCNHVGQAFTQLFLLIIILFFVFIFMFIFIIAIAISLRTVLRKEAKLL